MPKLKLTQTETDMLLACIEAHGVCLAALSDVGHPPSRTMTEDALLTLQAKLTNHALKNADKKQKRR